MKRIFQAGAIEGNAVAGILEAAGLPPDQVPQALELLLWFGFLGARDGTTGAESYSHEVRFNLRRLSYPVEQGSADLVVHPAFRAALGIT
jgi:hypothetical protein